MPYTPEKEIYKATTTKLWWVMNHMFNFISVKCICKPTSMLTLDFINAVHIHANYKIVDI